MRFMKYLYPVVLLAAAVVAGAIAPQLVGTSRAQLSASSTWVPAGNVGGTAGAVTLASIPGVAALNDLLGVPLRFIPTANSVAGGTTVAPNGLAATAVRRASAGALVAIADHDFSTTVMAEIIYDGTQFVQKNPATGVSPVGSEIQVTGTTVPAGYLVENGVCVSTTTYAALYAYYGSSDIWSPGSTGGACAGGQFHLPYANGTVAAAYDTQGSQTASKLTSAGSGCAATSVAIICGAQNRTIATSGLPNNSYTPSITVGVGGPQAAAPQNGATPLLNGNGAGTSVFSGPQFGGLAASTYNLNGGVTQTATTTVQPTRTVTIAVKY